MGDSFILVRTKSHPLLTTPKELVNPLLVAGHESPCRKRRAVDVRPALAREPEIKLTERLFRIVATVGYFLGLAKSNLVYTFVAAVRLPISPPPPTIVVLTSRHLPSALTFIRVHLLTSATLHRAAQHWEYPSA